MSLNRTLYFMSLVGGMSGLFSWGILRLIEASLPSLKEAWAPDVITMTILGALIGGLTVAFTDHFSGNRVVPRWIISGTLIGLTAGAIAGVVSIPITDRIAPSSPLAARLITWMIAGSLIGLGLGLRWVHVNRMRAAHAYVGGLFGGLIGGALFVALSGVPDLSQAAGYVVLGVGISFGVTLAPILLRDAVLEFVSSGDARAQMKFGRSKKQWELHQGGSYTIGSRNRDLGMSQYRPDIEIFIPDVTIAPCHATLFSRDGRFFLARHQDAGGQAGLARYVLRVRGKTVTNSEELSNLDDILIGRTALKFVARRLSS